MIDLEPALGDHPPEVQKRASTLQQGEPRLTAATLMISIATTAVLLVPPIFAIVAIYTYFVFPLIFFAGFGPPPPHRPATERWRPGRVLQSIMAMVCCNWILVITLVATYGDLPGFGFFGFGIHCCGARPPAPGVMDLWLALPVLLWGVWIGSRSSHSPSQPFRKTGPGS